MSKLKPNFILGTSYVVYSARKMLRSIVYALKHWPV